MYLNNIIKPTHICNLNCTYCFNEDPRNPIMKEDVLERVIQQSFAYIASTQGKRFVAFIWHGGEPMVAKLPFYEKVVALQRKYNNGLEFKNTIQTNGTLINEKWVQFFKENNFYISISLDGPKIINDKVRNYHGGKSSFDKVMRGINLVRKAGLSLGVPLVISKANKDYPNEIIDFFIKERLPFQVIPLTRSGEAVTHFEDYGIGPEEYADPWIKMFDRWLDAKENEYIYCTDFVYKASAILAGKPSDCIGMEQCGLGNISTDPDGFIYPCATYSADANWLYGNIMQDDLSTLMTSHAAQKAANRVEDPHCTKCKWRHVCHGGCPSRAYKFYGTANTRDYYCPSLYRIYEHIEKRLRERDNLDLSTLPNPNANYNRKPPKERTLAQKQFIRQNEVVMKYIPKKSVADSY